MTHCTGLQANQVPKYDRVSEAVLQPVRFDKEGDPVVPSSTGKPERRCHNCGSYGHMLQVLSLQKPSLGDDDLLGQLFRQPHKACPDALCQNKRNVACRQEKTLHCMQSTSAVLLRTAVALLANEMRHATSIVINPLCLQHSLSFMNFASRVAFV